MKTKLVSAMTKVLPAREPEALALPLRALRGERLSFQTAVCPDATCDVSVSVRTDLRSRVREVGLVPVGLPCYPASEGLYISREPGLFPDPLLPLRDGGTRLPFGQWRAFFIDVEGDGDGVFPVEVTVRAGDETEVLRTEVTLLPHDLPPQKIGVTQWFHYDSLAEYYSLEMWSPRYFETLEKWLKNYSRLGGNTLLTPLFTPPLDTEPGGERLTAQLIDVTERGGEYIFGFERFEKFVRLAQSCGIERFELSHLFTQWGAAAAPKIVASDGRRIFGWDTPATGERYSAFLAAFLPRLREEIGRLGIERSCTMHVSDEPNAAQLESYAAAKALLKRGMGDIPITDALSNIEFYRRGCVETPVVSLDHIAPFLEEGVAPLWGYYCCGQDKNVSNRFIAQDLRMTRAFGAQAWKFRLAGFLQWGHNFYRTQLSRRRIDPWRVTDAEYAFPSGDAFSVYPGEDGEPIESIRAAAFAAALKDIRAFGLCEELYGRSRTLAAVENGTPVRFDDCTFSSEAARDRVNALLAK